MCRNDRNGMKWIGIEWNGMECNETKWNGMERIEIMEPADRDSFVDLPVFQTTGTHRLAVL